MAIHLKTTTPRKLLTTYKKAIDDGDVVTWSYDLDGDFTHTVEQWNKKAWLRPAVVEKTELVLHILAPKGTTLSPATYAVYHGRMIELMLRHCDGLFEEAIASALAEKGDVI